VNEPQDNSDVAGEPALDHEASDAERTRCDKAAGYAVMLLRAVVEGQASSRIVASTAVALLGTLCSMTTTTDGSAAAQLDVVAEQTSSIPDDILGIQGRLSLMEKT